MVSKMALSHLMTVLPCPLYSRADQKVRLTFRPMQLINIDIIGLQALKIAVNSAADMLRVKACLTITQKSIGDILLARMTLSRCLVLSNQVPMNRSVSPCLSLSGGDGYISAVSQKLTPSLSAISIWACASALVFCCPQVIVPRQILDTFHRIAVTLYIAFDCPFSFLLWIVRLDNYISCIPVTPGGVTLKILL